MAKVRGNEMKYNNMSSTTYENMTRVSSKAENKDDLIKYHERIITRIYPKGRNIFSGNFNPISNWRVGVQMSALNFQTANQYLRLNSAMFQQNGNCGYVLKPCLVKVSAMQLLHVKYNQLLQDSEERTCIVKIRILEARHLSCLKPQKEIFHQPHVRVELFGDFEEDKKTWSTNDRQNIQYNGFHPIWNKTLEPHLVANRDMAFLEFTLSEVSDNLGRYLYNR